MDQPSTEDRILNSAQRLIQQRGYNGFSYRDIAAEIGIRSASIHYHFPAKADLGQAVARRYCDQFTGQLLAFAESAISTHLAQYVSMFRGALEQDDGMCLCGILGAEVAALPDIVVQEARRFFAANREWLTGRLRRAQADGELASTLNPETEARLLFATLQGAMLCAKTIGKTEIFDEIADAALQRIVSP